MKYREIQIIREILIRLNPRKCLEWGAGYSTLIFPNYLRGNYKWIAIEHDKQWYNIVKSINRNPRVNIFWIPLDNYPWSDPYKDGSYEDLKEYINFPAKFGKFDFILIDGRSRLYCLIKASQIVKENGVVILYDANRVHYPLHLLCTLTKFFLQTIGRMKGEYGLGVKG